MRHLRPLLAITLALCCCRPATAAAIPAPATLPDATVFLAVYIPDLLGTIDRLEQVSAAINPKFPRGSMKMGLGTMLGDPQLASFAKGPVVIVLAPGMPMPTFAMVLPTRNAQGYIDALAKTGTMGKAVGGNLVLSKLPDGLELGERVAAKLGELGAKPVKGDIRILLACDKLVQSYGAFLLQMATMPAAMAAKQPGMDPGPAQMTKLLPLYAAALTLVGGDIGMHQIDLGFGTEAITIESITEARAGSELAKALIAPVPCLHASEQRLGPAGGMVLASLSTNTATLGGYMKHVLAELAKRPEGKDFITPDMLALIDLAIKSYTGDWALRMRPGEPGGTPFVTQAVHQVNDGQGAVDLQFRMMDLMFGDQTALGRMYQAMGMTCIAKRDARSVGAAKVHTLTMHLDAAKAPAGQAQQMQRFMIPTEMAVANGFLLLAQGEPVDALLQPMAQGPTLKARTVLGTGHHAYCDLDPAGLALMITQMIPFPQIGELTAKLKLIPTDKPFTASLDVDAGRIRSNIHLPIRPLADLTKAFENLNPGRNKPKRHDEAPEELKPKDGATLF